jgi:hypothetical protein
MNRKRKKKNEIGLGNTYEENPQKERLFNKTFKENLKVFMNFDL